MARWVNFAGRAELLVEAAWALAAEGGPPAVTVRKVSERSGVSIGSMRRWSPHQERVHQLALFVLGNHRTWRTLDRAVQEAPFRSDQRLVETLVAVLPLDEVRRNEEKAWFSYVGLAGTRELYGQLVSAGAEHMWATVASALQERYGQRPERRLVDATYCLLTGLALAMLDPVRPLGVQEARAALELMVLRPDRPVLEGQELDGGVDEP